MANTTRQVPEALKLKLMAELNEIRSEIEKRHKPFKSDQTSKRRYPAESEGNHLAKRLNEIARQGSRQGPLLESLVILQKLDQAAKAHDIPAIDQLRKDKRRGLEFAYGYLVDTALTLSRRDRWLVSVHEDGIIFHPRTLEAKSALAVLVLEMKRRIDRVRRCQHCGDWFFARFKPQKFCRGKDCQWNHYHSPEWRKQNRERNRRHQRRYREKLFAKRRFEPLGEPKKKARVR